MTLVLAPVRSARRLSKGITKPIISHAASSQARSRTQDTAAPFSRSSKSAAAPARQPPNTWCDPRERRCRLREDCECLLTVAPDAWSGRRLSRNVRRVGGGARFAGGVTSGGVLGDRACRVVQAAAGVVWWRWSFRRLWVAVISRHFERPAALPRRWNRSARRLCLMCAKTGSIITCRCL